MRKQCGLWVLIIVSSGAWSHIKAQRLEPRPQSSSTPPGTVLVAAASLPGPESWPVGKVLTTESEQERRIRTGLEQPLTHEFTGMKLADLAPLLEERLKCTVVFDRPAMSADGMEPEKVELRGKAQGRALRQELRSLLDSRRLKVIIRDDCLRITTGVGAEVDPQLRVYQVHDLVVRPDDLIAGDPQFDALETLVRGHITIGDWMYQGGTKANLRSFQGAGILALVIVQSEEGHEQVESLLEQLRAAKVPEVAALQRTPVGERLKNVTVGGGVEGRNIDLHGPSLPPPPPLPRGRVFCRQTKEDRRIHEALRENTELNFDDARLDVIADAIGKRHNIPVELDVAALTADGRGPATKFSVDWHSGTLRGSLTNMLREQGLTFVVRHDALRITTRTAAETLDETRIYQVHDLFDCELARVGERANYEVFQELISGMIDPETWREGNSTHIDIFGFEGPGLQCLAIRQTAGVHEEIERFLDLLRDAYVPEVYEAQRRRRITVTPKPAEEATKSGGGFY